MCLYTYSIYPSGNNAALVGRYFQNWKTKEVRIVGYIHSIPSTRKSKYVSQFPLYKRLRAHGSNSPCISNHVGRIILLYVVLLVIHPGAY